MITLCREELGTHLRVKTTEKDLLVIRNAEEMFQSRARPIEKARGIDLSRGVAFQIQAVCGLRRATRAYLVDCLLVSLPSAAGRFAPGG